MFQVVIGVWELPWILTGCQEGEVEEEEEDEGEGEEEICLIILFNKQHRHQGFTSGRCQLLHGTSVSWNLYGTMRQRFLCLLQALGLPLWNLWLCLMVRGTSVSPLWNLWQVTDNNLNLTRHLLIPGDCLALTLDP